MGERWEFGKDLGMKNGSLTELEDEKGGIFMEAGGLKKNRRRHK